MRNITGSPTEGDDFFDRPLELKRLLHELEQGANLRINAPRRVGKTSLVLRLCEEWRLEGRKAVFLNVEDKADELSFVEKLLDSLLATGLQPDTITGLKLWMRNARKAIGLSKVSVGLDLEIGDSAESQSTLSQAVEKVFRQIEADGKEVLIAIDEMPEILLALSKSDNGPQRVSQLLHWLRALRQTFRKHIRWVFLGSIGLEGFVEERLLGKTINDLTSFSLDALSLQEAHAFLERLGADNGLPLSSEIREQIIARVGWPLPHHLQIVFHAMRDLGATQANPAILDQAFARLLGPEHLTEFDTWRQRLDEQFIADVAASAKAILNHLCQHAQGRTRQQCLNALMKKKPTADPQAVEEELARLLQLLQRDGYLLESQGRYAFRSFLLRDYWHRRYIV